MTVKTLVAARPVAATYARLLIQRAPWHLVRVFACDFACAHLLWTSHDTNQPTWVPKKKKKMMMKKKKKKHGNA